MINETSIDCVLRQLFKLRQPVINIIAYKTNDSENKGYTNMGNILLLNMSDNGDNKMREATLAIRELFSKKKYDENTENNIELKLNNIDNVNNVIVRKRKKDEKLFNPYINVVKAKKDDENTVVKLNLENNEDTEKKTNLILHTLFNPRKAYPKIHENTHDLNKIINKEIVDILEKM